MSYTLPPLERSVIGNSDFLVKEAKFKFKYSILVYANQLCDTV